jgi:chromosome segregation ATPase
VEVGKRLEGARQQETQVREGLARLAQETAAKTADTARAEQRIQQAREAEASLEQQHTAVRGQMEEIVQQRAQSEQALAALTTTVTSAALKSSKPNSSGLRLSRSWPS